MATRIGFLGWVPYQASTPPPFGGPFSMRATPSAIQGAGTYEPLVSLRLTHRSIKNGTRFPKGTGVGFPPAHPAVEALSRLRSYAAVVSSPSRPEARDQPKRVPESLIRVSEIG